MKFFDFDKELMKFYFGIWNYRLLKERIEVKIVLDNIKPGDVVVDIGAYKGTYAYWMSQAVGKAGKVYAFEPQKYAEDHLRRIIDKMEIKNIVLESMGISSEQGEMSLALPEGREYSALATFETKSDKAYKTYTVPVETLDNYFQKLNISKISFIKCDVEGHELEVFRGGIETLKKHKPVLFFECEQRYLRNNKMNDVFDFLQQIGYKGQFINDDGLHPLAEFQIERHQVENKKPYVNNFLFSVTT